MKVYLGVTLLFFSSLVNLCLSVDKNKCQFSAFENQETAQTAVDKLGSLVGKSFLSEDYEGSQTDYLYTVGICSDVSAGLENSGLVNAAVLQRKKDNGEFDPKAMRKVGSLEKVHAMSGSDWVYLEYKGGEKYSSHCGQEEKRSVLIVTCDPSVGDDDARMVFVKEETQKTEDCFYLFEMKHKAVCPTASLSGGLSVGSILVIVFIVVAGVYLLVGFLYSRFLLGHKGMEQIPNYEFWQDFGNLVADGCDLVCRSGSGGSRSGTLGGLGDNQLDTEDTVRDENLLPM